MPQGRALAWGLIAAGVGIAVLFLLWIVVNAVGGRLQGGGFVFGLILLLILGGTPLGVGLYLLSRGKVEEQEGQAFERQRRVLDADRILRQEMSRDFRQQADRLASNPAGARFAPQLRDLAEDLERPGYDQAAFYDTIGVDQEAQDQLRRYNDLLVEEQRRIETSVRALEAGGANAAAELQQALDRWEQQYRARQDILLRGRRAPSVSAAELLRSREPTKGASALAALKRGDAVSYDDNDYLVEATATYFASGRTWSIHTLRAERDEQYLYVGPGGITLALLQPTTPPATLGEGSFTSGDGACPLSESGSASATAEAAAGRSEGTLVDYWRYACPNNGLAWVERWPNDPPRAYLGTPLNPAAFDVWPAA